MKFKAQVILLNILFFSMDISSTNSILPRKMIFDAKILHHEEKSISSADNLPKFINPLPYTIKDNSNNFNCN